MNDRHPRLRELCPHLNRLATDAKARVTYDMFAGGLKWTDESPPVGGYAGTQ